MGETGGGIPKRWGGDIEQGIVRTYIEEVDYILDQLSTKRIPENKAVEGIFAYAPIFFSLVPEDITEITFAPGVTITHNARLSKGLPEKNCVYSDIKSAFETATNPKE